MTEPNLETRVFSSAELRMTKGDDGVPRFEGYAAVFNKWSEDLGGFREKIAPKAFTRALKDSDTRALFNHDSNYVLGRTTSKTLDIQQDNKGLRFSVIPPDTQWARDLGVSMERGDITQCSFGFVLAENGDEWREKDGAVTRTIKDVQSLADVSVVTYPAYPDTTVALRSMESVKAEPKPDIIAIVDEMVNSYFSPQDPTEEQREQFSGVLDDMIKRFGKPMQADGGPEDEVMGEEPDSAVEPMLETADISPDDCRRFWAEGDGK